MLGNIWDLLIKLLGNPLLIAIIIVSLFSILAFLFYLIIHRKNKAHSPIKLETIQEGIGPKEWEHQMISLSNTHKNVKWEKYNFVVSKYNQKVYKKINIIRSSISQTPWDIITLIPSARWVFDNFQMLYREIKKVKTTGTSYLSLPILQSTEYRGYPRIYVLAKKMVDISGGYLNEESTTLMVKAYQKELPLTDRELHTLPEMIGLCLLERIIEVAQKITGKIETKCKAERFVKEKLIERQGYLDITPLLVKLGGYFEDISFHCHVIYLLKNMSVEDDAIQRYIDFHRRAEKKYLSSSEIFKEEGKIESLLESNIRTPIISLREINQLDEESIFEELSQLENILLKDPDKIYPQMDSKSKGLYRGVIEKLAFKNKIEEGTIGKACLGLANSGMEGLNCSHHVGTYLIGKGYQILKATVLKKRIPKKPNDDGIITSISYFSMNLFFLIGFYCLIASFMYWMGGVRHLYQYAILLVVSTPVLMDLSLKITNNILTRLVPVQIIPSMDYIDEIPDSARTFVVIPVIVSTKEQGLEYLENLHKQYLANLQANLYFALLVDYGDSVEKELSEDELIKGALIKQINRLNKLYPSHNKHFSLFIRHRLWNEAENCYMGRERKRGKLEEFNALLNGIAEEQTSFSTILCDKEILGTFKYVITLDADTSLIRDNAAMLVGVIDHPLNRAVIDPDKRKVKEGYAIIQPSVRNHILNKKSSFFPKVYGGHTGVANYSMLTSDVYQDIFKEGTFVGKGIYNVQAFHQLLYKTLPENRVLSHDLLESCYARTAFVSTINIMENFPSNYISYKKREHRWIRGDWQLLSWLFKDRLSLLSRWKILDNMRASLVPISKLLLILLCLILMPKASYLWVPIVFFPNILDITILLAGIVIHKIRRPKLALVYSRMLQEVYLIFQRSIFDIVFIPSRAFSALDAIIRTLFRMLVSKKHLLMWNPADIVEKTILNTKKGYFLNMWLTLIPTLLVLVLVLINGILSNAFYISLILVWGLSFLIAYKMSQSNDSVYSDLIDKDGLLKDTARRMWRFFRDFSTKENNWLCPDNYQIKNREKVTDKTSPTNIGLQFLSVLSARDLGFESLGYTLEYIENLLYTVSVLPKWRGHLFNWYNIRNLSVLNPQYISTVDSGNFFGNLIAFKNGLLEQKNTPIIPDCIISELKELMQLSKVDDGLKCNYPIIDDFLKDIIGIKKALKSKEYDSSEDLYIAAELVRLIDFIAADIIEFDLGEHMLDDHITLSQKAQLGNAYANTVMDGIDGIVRTIENMNKDVDFTPLFNNKRMLFHIGYNATNQLLDAGCYDLVASESILTSFLTIARGEIPSKHWQKLGRPLALINGIPAHVSWSGTMFEYLMPNLIMKTLTDSVFNDSSRAAVIQQIKFAKRMGIPWGISESQYHRFDLDSNYQYRAFGVPMLRLQPSYSNSLVVSPYSTMLALENSTDEALSNLKRMEKLGARGKYGFYEALDFNDSDPINMTPYLIVKSFMAHHQGMSLVAVNNLMNDGIMRNRFHAEPMVKATESLLEEKRQTYFISISRKGYTVNVKTKDLREDDILSTRRVKTVAPSSVIVNHISNGNYSLLITSDGDGFSEYNGMMLYRWRPDIYASTGNYIYIKDLTEGKIWSTAYNPTKTEPNEYQVIFSYHKTEFARKDGDISTKTVVSISPSSNLELRKVTLKNYSEQDRQIEITSYLEIVGDSFMAELSHPAFNKLFLESEFIEENKIFLSRRRNNKENNNAYIMHMVKSDTELLKSLEYENDRLRFIGRNNTVQNPEMVVESVTLSNSAGFSNDPIMSLRVRLHLKPGQTANVTYVTGVCNSREEAIKTSDELDAFYRIDNIIENFRQQSLMEMKYLSISGQQLNAYQSIISPIFYPSRHYRGPVENIRRNWKNQSFLWRFGVSGDNPIMLLRINSIKEVWILKDVLKAYEYLRTNNVRVDLIILSEAKYGYMQELTDLLNDMTSSLRIFDEDKEKPSLFILHSYQMVPAELDLLFTVARVVFSKKTGIYFRNIKGLLQETIIE